ncbi:bifunctional DNA primase/helicase [Desulfogranum mediterraneum]|uniref:bifunctional DNA primase/helicase n=1 Tax=Desulfogranum mediterraneum TaxID=160661 RepID=UPI00041B1B1D|nr:bifunctional DNA primase/helicase [Desulfogranum mediterraneum]
MSDAVSEFYQNAVPEALLSNKVLKAPCPFCRLQGKEKPGQLTVFLNEESFFHGYFQCQSRCSPGGFPLSFARQLGLDLHTVPGYDPEREYLGGEVDLPVKNINQEVIDFTEKMTTELRQKFERYGISPQVLSALQIGYNGRYLVYPYIQSDGNYYAARCVHPDKAEDAFWYGNEQFTTPRFHLFNQLEIQRCENGALILVEGEQSLLTLKELGLPVIALPAASDLEQLDPLHFRWIETLYLWVNNSAESMAAARNFATRTGYKVRLVRWQESQPRDYSLPAMAHEYGSRFQHQVFAMLQKARAFSPFATPEQEYQHFKERLHRETENSLTAPPPEFLRLSQALGGFKGINIMGGTPKSGKSCLFIQLASELARQKRAVIYYDFENGKQKIYQRTLARLSRLAVGQLAAGGLDAEEQQRLDRARKQLQGLLRWFRVVNDRKLSPETMRRHIDFLQHETRSNHTVVVVDSLHKLPFKDLSQRRSGIDGWLRQMEAIRDEQNVTFLVISELTRGQDGQFERVPQLGSFKGSGDIAYSADNALVFLPQWDPFEQSPPATRCNDLWLVASREQPPGKISSYRLDYPFWGFVELCE